MTWRYQLLHNEKEGIYRVCEVFYDEGKKKPFAYAELGILGETPEEVKQDLQWMLQDTEHYPILKTSDFKNEPDIDWC